MSIQTPILLAGSLLTLASLAAPAPAQAPGPPRRVLAAEDPSSGARAWLLEGGGLVLERGEGRELLLGDAFAPRFDARGELWFERAVQVGEVVLEEQLWSLAREAGLPLRRAAGSGPARPEFRPRTSPAVGAAVRVCIDPGHGGSDPGAVAQGQSEAPINLDVALRLADLLAADTLDAAGGGEWEVLLTRVDDTTVSLGTRVALANAWPADRFVSIHANAFSNPAANGTETYSFAEGTTGADLRDRIQEEMLDAWGLVDRGTKTAGFFVLANTVMPATLSELGFLTSPIDIVPLTDPASLQRAAEAHLFALQRHLGLAPYLPAQNPALYCEAKVNSRGCTPSAGWQGTPTLGGADDLVLTVSDVLPGQFGVLFWGHQPSDLPFGGGTLCAQPPLVRTGLQLAPGSPTDPGCAGSYAFAFTHAYMGAAGLQPGSEVFAQWWARDPGFAGLEAISLSAGVRFLVEP